MNTPWIPRLRGLPILLLCWGCLLEAASGEPRIPALALDLPVTNGLIRWWPNLFDAHDEISGQEGVVMGVLPPVEAGVEDETEFGGKTAFVTKTGWVQLQPVITNEVFTFSFWVRCSSEQTAVPGRVLGQESSEGEWFFQSNFAPWVFAIGGEEMHERDWEQCVELRRGVWQHVAIARKADGTSIVWVDGTRKLEGRMAHSWPSTSRWLSVGDELKGDRSFCGALRDLCAFDRVLADTEVQALHAAGRRKRPARNTPARLAATGRSIRSQISTNLVAGPQQKWVHQRFTTEDGLPANIVKAVLQARNGYLWVGTEEGLARFDGRRFQPFTAENTPALKAIGQTVWSLSEDTDGTIWAGIFGGLLRIRGLGFTAFTNGLPQRFVLQAEPAGDGSVWVAGFRTTVPRGPCWIRRYHPDSETSSAEVAVPGHVRRLVPVTNGVWFATEQPYQMNFWDGRSATASVVGTVDDVPSLVRLVASRTLPDNNQVRAWRFGADYSNCWAEVYPGIDAPAFYWLWDSRKPYPHTGRWTGPAAADEWLGVSYDLARLRGNLIEPIEIAEHSPGPEISCVCGNREGGVWFGTEEDGLHFVQERLVRVFTTQDGLSANDVRSVCATPDGGLWVGTAVGASRWRGGQWTRVAQGAPIRTVASSRRGELWTGHQEGSPVALRKEHAGKLQCVSIGLEWQDPNSLRFARDGTLWVVCERGLTWLKPEALRQDAEENWVPDPTNPTSVFGRYTVGKDLPAIRPLGLVEDRDGSMWMGSLEGGLFHITNGRVQNFTQQQGLPGNRCVPALLDDSGALWIVTDGGLCRRQGDRFQSVGVKEGLPKDILLDLIEDGLGNFWISGKRGIHWVTRHEVEEFFAGRVARVHSLTLGARDGLLTPECSNPHEPIMAKTPDGHIWVATRNGLATFDPHRVRLDTQPLPAIIERIVGNSEEIPDFKNNATAGSFTLAPGSGRQLEFHYTAISLVGADRIRFRHRLDGYDSAWSAPTDLRLAFYTNLRPGKYRFRVKASNPHGIWNDRATTLDFMILPYFWQTRLFYAGLAVAITAAAAGLHYRRLTIQRRMDELKHQQALTSEKARIAADMHDELGAALTQISVWGEVARSPSIDEAQTRSMLERISQAARDVTSRMSDLVWATNPHNDTLDNLAAHLREQAASQLQDAAIQARLEFPSDVPEQHVSATFRRNLLLITKEALQNVLKHAEASEVCVHLELIPAALVLRIQDNGKGFNPAASKANGNGLGNMQKRARDLAGELTVHSVAGQGTRIEAKLPLDSGWQPKS